MRSWCTVYTNKSCLYLIFLCFVRFMLCRIWPNTVSPRRFLITLSFTNLVDDGDTDSLSWVPFLLQLLSERGVPTLRLEWPPLHKRRLNSSLFRYSYNHLTSTTHPLETTLRVPIVTRRLFDDHRHGLLFFFSWTFFFEEEEDTERQKEVVGHDGLKLWHSRPFPPSGRGDNVSFEFFSHLNLDWSLFNYLPSF